MVIIKKLVGAIIPWSVKRMIYRTLAMKYINDIEIPQDKTRKTIVVLNHFFDQDVQALKLANKDFNIVVIDPSQLFRGAKIFFDLDVRDLFAPYDQADQAMISKYREECTVIFDLLQKRTGIDLVVTASDIFYWIREFVAVAEENNVATVVLDKEGTLSTDAFNSEAERTKTFAPFISKLIFVWSERQREFWTRIGAKDNQIKIIGQPRSDLLHNEKSSDVDSLFPTPQPIVTLFSYADDAYIPTKLIVSEQLTWKMKQPTHEEFFRLACQHPDYNFIIKTHPQQPDLQQLRTSYDRENLRVIGGSAIANELLRRSELIIAFQTTAVIEGMLLGRNIIYTYWDELIERLQDDIVPLHEAEGICVARTFEEFKNISSAFLNGERSAFDFTLEQIAGRERFVNRYFHKPDGHVCERFFSEVEEMLA